MGGADADDAVTWTQFSGLSGVDAGANLNQTGFTLALAPALTGLTSAAVDPNSASGGALTISNSTTQSSAELVKITGTASFTALNVATGNTVLETMTLASGSITDSSGTVSFGDENLVTTGTADLGATTVDSLSASNGGITNAGAISGATTVTASGTATLGAVDASSGGISNAGAISGATTIAAGGDVTIFEASNGANPVLALGASSAENLSITATYDSAAQTLDKVTFATKAASATANKGKMEFLVDEALIFTANDSAINLASTMQLEIDGTSVLTSTTLGSGVVNSSLAAVGVLAAGSIASGFGSFDNGSSTMNTGAATVDSLDASSGGITNAGAISGATTVTASGALSAGAGTLASLNASSGGITNAGAISGATTVTASGAATVVSLDAGSGGITNAGAISGATTISASGTATVQAVTVSSGGITDPDNVRVKVHTQAQGVGNFTIDSGYDVVHVTFTGDDSAHTMTLPDISRVGQTLAVLVDATTGNAADSVSSVIAGASDTFMGSAPTAVVANQVNFYRFIAITATRWATVSDFSNVA